MPVNVVRDPALAIMAIQLLRVIIASYREWLI
jgi:hypothetical protein